MADHENEISRRRFLTVSLTGLAAAGMPQRFAQSAAAGTESAAARQRVADALLPAEPSEVRLAGYVGQMLGLCIRNRVMAQDVEKLVQPFRAQSEVGDGDWRCEYWGKWHTSAVPACEYQPTPANRAVVDRAVRELLAAQNADGYIGTRQKEHRLLGWDVWGRKYVLLGLLATYDMTGDGRVLEAARRHADSLLAETGPGKANIAAVGFAGWKGLPPSSVLEPMVVLYRRTGDAKYLRYARYIVGQWSQPNALAPGGLQLVERALQGTPVADMVSPKAYEMTSCYEGLCELYRTTGDAAYLEACKKVGDSIMRDELFIVGSGSSREVWFGGRARQSEPNPDPMETCVTATWMKYCFQLLRLTGEARYADQLEISLYNALLGALKPDGSWWCYYTPLMGSKRPSHVQHGDVGLSCCVASGPRALTLTPRWAVMTSRQGPVVNLYCRGAATVTLASGNRVRLEQNTDYPLSGRIHLTIQPQRREKFMLRLRIPAWSRQTALVVNGKPVSVEARPGAYAALTRTWRAGDEVALTLDLRGRVIADPGGSGRVAVMRGPIVLAVDRRLQPAQSGLGLSLRQDASGHVPLSPVRDTGSANVWMAFDAACGAQNGKGATALRLCDYASAGNTWSSESEFRVWLPQPLDLFEAQGLGDAQWIWFAGDGGELTGDPQQQWPVGTRYFRGTFELPAGIALKRARLRITADDAFILHVNGQQAGRGDAWRNPQSFDLSRLLQPGRNVLAVEATNTNPSPAGLIARLEIVPLSGKPLAIKTGAAWKSTDRNDAGWQSPHYDDRQWQGVKVLGVFGCQPWGAII